MNHDIPKRIRNSVLEYCINEYVRYGEHRDMLRDHWFNKLSLQDLAEKYHYSLTTVKDVIYDTGDFVIEMASEYSE